MKSLRQQEPLRKDSWIDIDGGIGTLFVISSKGRRELPNEKIYIDGDLEPLSKRGSFVGRHVCVPLEGCGRSHQCL